MRFMFAAFLLSISASILPAHADLVDVKGFFQSRPGDTPAALIEEFEADFHDVLLAQGNESLSRRVNQLARKGFNLQPLREAVYAETRGVPREIEVPVHPDNVAMVEFGNKQLDQVGIEFYRYRAVLDETQPKPTEPFKVQTKSHGFVKLLRSVGLPLVAAWATVSDQGQIAHHPEIVAGAMGLAVYVLESQFGWLSSWWDKKCWSKDNPLVREMSYFKGRNKPWWQKSLNSAIYAANQVLGGLARIPGMSIIKESYFWSLAVNGVYRLALFTVKLGAMYATGNAVADMSLTREFLDNVWTTAAFFASFGLFQIFIGELKKRGQMSEFVRYIMESAGAAYNKFARVLGLDPSKMTESLVLHGIFMVVATIPAAHKLIGTKIRNAETKRLFEETARAAKEGIVMARDEDPSLMERAGAFCKRTLRGFVNGDWMPEFRFLPDRRFAAQPGVPTGSANP